MGYINKNIHKEVFIGIIAALIATASGLFLYLEFISDTSIIETIKKVQKGGVLGAVLALGAIPNLLVFWVFLKKNQEYRARGVLITTVIIALITLILKFL